ncbi:hypothetical protein CKA32_005332 [Geitlerinema sp. FC II]|nr:hypothetical protein CKA32_005332 [Geitlerinema sp. FC II]
MREAQRLHRYTKRVNKLRSNLVDVLRFEDRTPECIGVSEPVKPKDSS